MSRNYTFHNHEGVYFVSFVVQDFVVTPVLEQRNEGLSCCEFAA